MAMKRQIKICHVYPEILNLYGDRGNVIALYRRCLWHGLAVHIQPVTVGEAVDFLDTDLVFIGGGQDREQAAIYRDLVEVKGPYLLAAAEQGMAILAVCGGFQLLGKYYRTQHGEIMKGVGLFDAWTEAGRGRLIGDVVLETDLWEEEPRTIVGFENHSGRTFLGEGVKPLGRVLQGFGNDGASKMEGAVSGNAIGTYLHGSLLPKNPRLADYLIRCGLERRYGPEGSYLTTLNDELEYRAHQAAAQRAVARRC
jgi:CobQ-like glutamine amidotransferase family enzyme